MAPSPEFVAELLSFIEEREERLQGWGFYDVAFDPSEIEALFSENASDDLRAQWDELESTGETMTHLLSEMRHAGLLHKLPDGSGRLRTRFAEGVRLLARLRQRFGWDDWGRGKRLISDIKIHLAPRRYPKVDIKAVEAWDAMADVAKRPALQRAVFEALASKPDGTSFTFAGFQVRSFRRILENYGSTQHSGTVVCAGTGSGKTKAFYVPAFVGMAPELDKKEPAFTKVIAVYPRNVLLADQLREAIAEAGKLSKLAMSHNLRPVTFGALIGDTPPAHAFDVANSIFLRNWRRHGTVGWKVPFLRAPFHASRCELVWLDSDRKAGRTCLHRIDALNEPPEIPDGVIQLTREGIQKNPPDFLFLSLEMLNRELGNPVWAKSFGIGVERTPRLLLFDEAHNYSGLSGAQAPWIIARWRQAARPQGLHVVGLSATLREAPQHLATVGCVRADRVVEFKPMEDELTAEGREANLAVKADASSGAPLLAASIQVAMLSSRLLTPRHMSYPKPDSISGKALYLRKVFGFTDQLDSLNRWLSDLRDAERNKRLAQYRMPLDKSGRQVTKAVERAMEIEGQIWSMPDALGYDLGQAAIVSRCSSQDPGADNGSDVIVATASLEVGYDDPDVGTIVHHKAPRSMSSFLQRKGRAGRHRGSRPTTIVVLSDYGRDRWFFQNSERLFQPEIDPITVPMLNPYVLRVQATSFLLDWIGRRVRSADPFVYLRRPSRFHSSARAKAADLLRRMLELGDEYSAFRRDLAWVFRHTQRLWDVGDDEIERMIDAVLWEAPRPVLRNAVPTLLRKLEMEWRFADPTRSSEIEDKGASQPLPGFIPSASFAELDLAEVTVEFPGTDKENETRSLAAQLSESCPGRVSKRYSVKPTERGYWLQGSEVLLGSTGAVTMSVADLFPEHLLVDTVADVTVYQPQRMALVERPKGVKDSSNGQWEWKSTLSPITEGREIPLFAKVDWRGVFDGARAFLHADHSGIRVLRTTSVGTFGLMLANGTEQRGSIRLGRQSGDGSFDREALGFEQTVDAFALDVSVEHLEERPALTSGALARLRQDFFRHRLAASPLLNDAANRFTLDWVWQTSLAMLSATALKNRCSLEEAQMHLSGLRPQAIGKVLSRMFSMNALSDDVDDNDAGGKMRDRLLALWTDRNTATAIEAAERTLWGELGADFDAWLRDRHLRTLVEALLSTVQTMVTDIGEGELIADVVDMGDKVMLVVSETAPGGIGQIEAFVARALEEEGTFERALMRALDHCPRTHISSNLLSAVDAVRSGGPMADAFEAVRNARGYTQAIEARAMLADTAESTSLDASRSMIVSMMGRLLQTGSRRETDAWVAAINKIWRTREERLGTVIEPRVFAYLCVSSTPVRREIRRLIQRMTGEEASDTQLFTIVQDFLLPLCHDTCPQCLAATNRFVGDTHPSRELSLQWIAKKLPAVTQLGVAEGWAEELKILLRTEDRVDVLAAASDLPEVGRTLQALVTEPMDRDYVMVWPILGAVGREGDCWRLRVELRGMGQA